MNYPGSSSSLSLTPLGAGDLIDRSIRFYRKNFWTFILIAAPPIIVGALFLVGWMTLARSLFAVNPANPYDTTLYPFFVAFGWFLIWGIQLVAVFVVMGGASRNFVRHLLFGEEITFRATYRNVLSRLGGLILVSVLIVVLLGIYGIIMFYIGLILLFVVIGLSVWLLNALPVVAFLVALTLGLAVVFGALWVFFLGVSRFVYVPQVMLVEGQGAFAAISRSASLAGRNVTRVAALFIFTLAATYSALSLFYVPLLIYAWVNGIDLVGFEQADTMPAWFEIAGQVVMEVSLILLTPILMTGLCLLYVDERVRSEGYDIELMAARRLGEIPAVPQSYVNPLQPALAGRTAPAAPVPGTASAAPPSPEEPDAGRDRPRPERSPGSVLGLD